MIRAIVVLLMLARVLVAQPPGSPEDIKPKNLGQAIGAGAVDAWALKLQVEELKAELAEAKQRLATLEQLVPPYIPTYTWPEYQSPQAFDKLRDHLRGENIHPLRDVTKWSRAELAFVHDCDHIEELLKASKPLPALKDQRLRDWLRAKNPAKSLPKKLGWTVKRIVMHTQANCPPCEQWKAVELPQAQAEGVEVVFAGPDSRGTPAFDVQYCNDDQCRTLQFGNMRYQTMKQAGQSL